MCEWLGIKSCTNNNKAIKQSLQNLSDNGYIFYKVEGRTYHVSISNKGMKDKKLYKIRKKWIEAFRKYNKDNDGTTIDKKLSVDWIKILRVFIYLYDLKPGQIITIEQIAKTIEISETTAEKALVAIMSCNLKGLRIEKEIIKDKFIDDTGEIHWRTKGQEITIFVMFE